MALLIGTAHMLKRARRAARRRGAHLDPEAPPGWVLTENQILAIAGGLLALLVAGVASVFVGERIAHWLEGWRQARRERERRRAAHEQKLAQQEAKKTSAVLSADRAVRRAAAEAAARAEAEALIARTRAADAQSALEEAERAAERAADDQAARRAAAEIDARTRAAAAAADAAAAANSSAASYTLDAWDVEEGEEEDSAAGGGEVEPQGEAPRMELELNPVARGTEVSSESTPQRAASAATPLPLGYPRGSPPPSPAVRSPRLAQVRLESLQLGDACTARVSALWADLGCTRCGERTSMQLSGLAEEGSSKKAWCDKCAAVLSAQLRPCFLGAAAGLATAGYVETRGCTLSDVPVLKLLLMCSCGGERELQEAVRGRRMRDGCRQCHTPLPLYFSNLCLIRHSGAAGGAVARAVDDEEDEMEGLLKKLRKKNADQFKGLGLCVGKPLPGKGACRHFKHSYRWLRFPCCGRAWPCATCHAESECPAAQAGDAVWATRLLCGKCSREHPYSDKPCDACGNSYTVPGGGHWQGGDGCRDQQRLVKSDSRKHKGSSAGGVKKTVSAKSQRVGVAGARNTAAKKLQMAKPG